MILRKFVVAISLAIIGIVPASAQDFHPAPIQHQDAVVAALLGTEDAAYDAAHRIYVGLLERETALANATAALNAAMTAEERSAETLGELAMSASNAQAAKDEALVAYNDAMAAHDDAKQAYDAALGDPAAKVATLQAELDTAERVAAGQATKIANLEAKFSAFVEAVCKGHDYEHDHKGDYLQVCPTIRPIARPLSTTSQAIDILTK